MDEQIDQVMIGVRADTTSFARDVVAIKAALETNVGLGAEKAGRSIESALGRAVRTGKLSFDDLGAAATRVLDQIAGSAIRGGIASLTGSVGAGNGLTGLATTLVSAALGLPGRATGGPVSPGAAYIVGERGPELFVPTTSGRIAPPAASGGRDVKVSIAVQAGAQDAPRALTRSSRQVARAVAQAIAQAGD